MFESNKLHDVNKISYINNQTERMWVTTSNIAICNTKKLKIYIGICES